MGIAVNAPVRNTRIVWREAGLRRGHMNKQLKDSSVANPRFKYKFGLFTVSDSAGCDFVFGWRWWVNGQPILRQRME